MKLFAICLTLAVPILFGPGCSSSDDDGDAGGASSGVQLRDLAQLGMAYLNYQDVYAKGPAGWQELLEFCNDEQGTAAAIKRVQAAGYNVKWGVSLRDVPGGASTFVLAESPKGGPKLMLDGTIAK